MTRMRLGAGGRGRAARLGHPDVLADDEAELVAVEVDDGRALPGLEVALLVEHGIVRQRDLAVIREHLAVAQERGAVVDRVALVLGVADVDGDAAHRVADLRERRLDAAAQPAVQQQVLGRIAAERELGEQHEIAALRARALGVVQYFAGVRVDCADARVDLGEPDLHFSAVATRRPWPRRGRQASERCARRLSRAPRTSPSPCPCRPR